ncbi:MAG: DUF5658 family protein [Chthonomonadales bacterium]
MRLHRQTLVLAGIGLADLCFTLWLINTFNAWEANPLMEAALRRGLHTLVAVKLALLLLPLAFLEWAWRRRPAFVRRAANFAIVGYLAVFTLGIARANLAPHPVVLPPDPLSRRIWAQVMIEQEENWASKMDLRDRPYGSSSMGGKAVHTAVD